MYAVDRVKPPVPQKLAEDKEDKAIEEAKIQRAKIEEKKASVEGSESKGHTTDQIKHEFNQLADLISFKDDS